MIAQEEKRLKLLKESYEEQLLSLPKGTIRVRQKGKNTYYYLSYRNGKKVATDYIGKDENDIIRIKEQLEKRRHIEDMLKELSRELGLMKKVLGGVT
jgi:hypothetical protein